MEHLKYSAQNRQFRFKVNNYPRTASQTPVPIKSSGYYTRVKLYESDSFRKSDIISNATCIGHANNSIMHSSQQRSEVPSTVTSSEGAEDTLPDMPVLVPTKSSLDKHYCHQEHLLPNSQTYPAARTPSRSSPQLSATDIAQLSPYEGSQLSESETALTPNMATAPPPLRYADTMDKFEKENLLATEYNAMKQKELRESKLPDKDIWLLKHRMIHNLFDKIIKIEYGDDNDDSSNISLEDENSNGVNVQLDTRQSNRDVREQNEGSQVSARNPGSVHAKDSSTVPIRVSNESPNVQIDSVSSSKCDKKKIGKESNKISKAKQKASVAEASQGKPSVPQSSDVADSESTRRSISDFLLKKLLFPYDANLLERSKKTNAGSKRDKEKDRKNKLVEIHVNKEISGQSAVGASAISSSKDESRHGERSKDQLRAHQSRLNSTCVVRKRPYQNPDVVPTCTCCSDSNINKKVKCYHELSEQHPTSDGDNGAYMQGKLHQVGSNVSQSDDAKSQDSNKSGEQSKQQTTTSDLSKPSHKVPESNAQVCNNSHCNSKKPSVLTKSDIVNLIIQRIYLEENQETPNLPVPSADDTVKRPTTSHTDNVGKAEGYGQEVIDNQISQSSGPRGHFEHQFFKKDTPQLTMQNPKKCDTNNETEEYDDNEEVDNLLAKYKKYPIANKSRNNSTRNRNGSGSDKLSPEPQPRQEHSSPVEETVRDLSWKGRRSTSPPGSSSSLRSGEMDPCRIHSVQDSYTISSGTSDEDTVIDLSKKSSASSISSQRLQFEEDVQKQSGGPPSFYLPSSIVRPPYHSEEILPQHPAEIRSWYSSVAAPLPIHHQRLLHSKSDLELEIRNRQFHDNSPTAKISRSYGDLDNIHHLDPDGPRAERSPTTGDGSGYHGPLALSNRYSPDHP